jgi:hypothetical protein
MIYMIQLHIIWISAFWFCTIFTRRNIIVNYFLCALPAMLGCHYNFLRHSTCILKLRRSFLVFLHIAKGVLIFKNTWNTFLLIAVSLWQLSASTHRHFNISSNLNASDPIVLQQNKKCFGVLISKSGDINKSHM